MLIPNQINFNVSHRTCFFWTVDNPLLIKLISGYMLSIWCKINSWIPCLIPKCNAPCTKKIATKYFRQKLGGAKNLFFCQETCTPLLIGSSPRWPLQFYYLVCIENHLFILRVGLILNKEIESIYRSDRSDCT